MISIIATLTAKEGAEADFEAVAKELAAAVNANEEGCLFYALHKADAPRTYVFIERYRDEAAIEAHRKTDHFRSLGRKMGEFMDGRPVVQRLAQIS